MARIDQVNSGTPFTQIKPLSTVPQESNKIPLGPVETPRVENVNSPLENIVNLGPSAGASSHDIDPVDSGAVFSKASAQLQPPSKNASPTPEGAKQLRAWLDANQANSPEAETTWQYYEQIDQYLGPFGDEGYPLAYGKQYNQAFTANEVLMADPTAKGWVEKTTLALQESISDYIVQRYEEGSLGDLTETELREFAFDSHPSAYFESGLTDIVLNSPELLDDIVTIPAQEFIPGSGSVIPSLKQAVVTGGMVTGEIIDRASDTVVETVGEGLDYVSNSAVGNTVTESYSYVANSTVGRTVSQSYDSTTALIKDGWNKLWGNSQ